MEYVELPAPPPLDELVHCFWFLRGTFPDTDPRPSLPTAGGRNVSNHPSADMPFGWSADGYILFLSTRDRNARDVYRMKADGSGVVRLTTTR